MARNWQNHIFLWKILFFKIVQGKESPKWGYQKISPKFSELVGLEFDYSLEWKIELF